MPTTSSVNLRVFIAEFIGISGKLNQGFLIPDH